MLKAESKFLSSKHQGQSSKVLHFELSALTFELISYFELRALIYLPFGYFPDTNRFRKEKQYEIAHK